MIVFFSKIESKKLKALIDFLYDQINDSEIEEQTLFNRVKFLTDELEIIRRKEKEILEELSLREAEAKELANKQSIETEE